MLSTLILFLSLCLAPAASETPDITTIPAKAEKTVSGIRYVILKKGTGGYPSPNSSVTVHYTGWTMDGNSFDSSYERGQPITLSLQQVIEGWTEGMQLMQKGSTARFWIPEELAYKGRPGAPKGMLVFDIELFEFSEPPKTPEPLLPPAKAKRTAQDHPFLIDSKGSGKKVVTTSTVTIHYNIWTTGGQLGQSTQSQNSPVTMPISQMQPEWQELLTQMNQGDRVSLWHMTETSLQNYQSNPSLLHEIIVLDVQ